MQRTHGMMLMAASALALGGCQGAMWGNMFALGVTFSLFFGTLNLGRRPSASSTRQNQPSATRTVS